MVIAKWSNCLPVSKIPIYAGFAWHLQCFASIVKRAVRPAVSAVGANAIKVLVIGGLGVGFASELHSFALCP